MSIIIEDLGSNNSVTAPDFAGLRGKIVLRGNNNIIAIGDTPFGGGINITVKSNCSVSIGTRSSLGSTRIHAEHYCIIKIGNSFSVNGICGMSLHEPTKLIVGNGCLFADNVSLTTSDMHSIFDVATGCRINQSADISVGDHVWLGSGALVLKGVSINSGSIVGARSVVTKSIPAYSAAAGNPARVVRTNVTWDPSLTSTIPDGLRELMVSWDKPNSLAKSSTKLTESKAPD